MDLTLPSDQFFVQEELIQLRVAEGVVLQLGREDDTF
jgi:hypothetical protein